MPPLVQNSNEAKLNKNKKIFLIIAAIFLIIVILVSVDIARRTTFPGSKGNLEQRLLDDGKESSGVAQ